MSNKKILYTRDGRTPIPKDEKTSRVMSANKAKNTGPEIKLRKVLGLLKVRGYRLHADYVPGRPDIVFNRKKVAVFVHGCFWHRCPHCQLDLPKSNKAFWREKFKKNQERDTKKETVLKKAGWKVFVVWECQLKKDSVRYAHKLQKALDFRVL